MPAGDPPALPDDAWVVLDPAVEVLGGEVDGHTLACHLELEVGMAVPPGDGLVDFLTSLRGAPVRVGELRARHDDHALVDEMLAALRRHGFAHVASSSPPSAETRRRTIVIDLDAGAPLDVPTAPATPELHLRCARLSTHAAAIADLARRRRAGHLRPHHTLVHTTDLRCDPATRDNLRSLGAAVELDGVPWPAPAASIPGLAELTRHHVPVHARMRADRTLLDAAVRARAIDWTRGAHVTGLALQLDAVEAVADPVAIFDALRALETAIGDVTGTDLPDDEVLLGNTAPAPRAALSDAARRLRHAYVRWRVPLLKSFESSCAWAQVPEVEDRWVRAAEDLLPNQPDLLGLRPGSILVDVCGGLGRVARRLAPAVGADGLVISIELRRFLTQQARRFAAERSLTNLQFRPGLAERLPLPDDSADAAVNEWTGAIWELGLGPTMVREMARVVRPGGRIAVTHRLIQLRVDALDRPWVQYPDIHRWVRDAFDRANLTIVAERVWGQTVPSRAGMRAAHWVEQYLPRLVDPNNGTYAAEAPAPPRADVYLTLVGETT